MRRVRSRKRSPTVVPPGPPGERPSDRRHTIGIRRLVVLGLLATTGFGLALAEFAQPSDRDCSVTDRTDARFALELEGPSSGHDGHPTYHLRVTDRGQTVDPALVCLVSFPDGLAVVVDDVPRAHLHLERAVRRNADASGPSVPPR